MMYLGGQMIFNEDHCFVIILSACFTTSSVQISTCFDYYTAYYDVCAMHSFSIHTGSAYICAE